MILTRLPEMPMEFNPNQKVTTRSTTTLMEVKLVKLIKETLKLLLITPRINIAKNIMPEFKKTIWLPIINILPINKPLLFLITDLTTTVLQ